MSSITMGPYKLQYTAGELLGPLEHILKHFVSSKQTTCMEPGKTLI